MTAKRAKDAKPHRFGGDWTTAKLDVLAKYLASYTTALKDKPSKNQPFRKGYIDAFAGTGYRDARRDDESGDLSQGLLLPDLAEQEPQALLDGSARLALKTDPRFDRYVFIERSVERCAQLEALKAEFPDLASDIQIRQGDANAEIRSCARRTGVPTARSCSSIPMGCKLSGRLLRQSPRRRQSTSGSFFRSVSE